MHSPGINGEGELRGQPANQGSSGDARRLTSFMLILLSSLNGRLSAYYIVEH